MALTKIFNFTQLQQFNTKHLASLYNMNKISGKEFNSLFFNRDFYITSSDNESSALKHNIDKSIHFYDEDNICNMFKHNKYVRQVSVPSDAQVKIEYSRFSSNLLFIEERLPIHNYVTKLLKNNDALDLVFKNINYFPYIDSKLQTQIMCKYIAINDNNSIKYIRKDLLTQELCDIIVKNNILNFQYVPHKYQTVEMCVTAIAYWRYLTKFINPELLDNENIIFILNETENEVDNCSY